MTTTGTVQEARECRTCGEAVRYRSEREAERIADAGWIHAATGERRAPGDDGQHTQFDFHWAEPVPLCPKCQSRDYGSRDEAWGISSDCRACGYHGYVSIGD